VIVIDDGSTSEAALGAFAEQEALYPDWTFVRQENAGPGPARNRGLEQASGTYFLPFDSDNVAVPTMLERLSRAMELNPSRAATACHNLAFTDDEDIAAGRFPSRYSPTGGPRILACVENVYGDTCSIFRTEALRSVGGFEVNRWSPTEDWETFVKIAARGLEIDVLPRPLFYYRTDAGGRLQGLGTDPATKLRLRAHLLDEFFGAATLTDLERRELFECMQGFDDFVTEGVENRLAEQRRWHDNQMADLAAFRESELEKVRALLGGEREAERARADAAKRELDSLSKGTSGWLIGRMVRWRMR
jgi:glycosyltransferase involved in cell wall biosynthesis